MPHESNNQRAKLLHPSALSVLLGLFVVSQVVLGQLALKFPQVLGYAAQISPDEIVRLTNKQRHAGGLAAVNLDPQLSAAAAQKAADMFAKDYWAHVSSTGTQPWNFITQSGYEYRYAGENLARDFSDPSSVVSAWMNSPSHRENLLSDKYRDIGVAVIDGKLGGQDTTLVVQMFGTKLAYAKKAVTDISVQAAEVPVLPTLMPTPVVQIAGSQVSPFNITKALSLMILAVVIGVLVVDIIVVARRRIVRWTSRSMAHLAFMLFLLVSAIVIYHGQVL